jgi:hypothetical protein
MVESPLETPDFSAFQAWRKPVNGDFSGFRGCHMLAAPARGGSARRKSVFS